MSAAVGEANASDEQELQFRREMLEFQARSENKSIAMTLLGLAMIITGAAMAATRRRVEITAAGYGALFAGSIAALGAMTKYIRN